MIDTLSLRQSRRTSVEKEKGKEEKKEREEDKSPKVVEEQHLDEIIEEIRPKKES